MLLGVSCLQEDVPEPEERVRVGDVLPTFSVKLDDGGILSSSQLNGKVGVIVFFHTECPDCQKELPVIQSLYDRYKGNDSVVIVCISREQGVAEVKNYWSGNGLTVPNSAQNDRSVYELFCTTGIPRTYITGPDLKIRAIFTDDPLATFDDLKQVIEDCLPEGN